MLKIKSHLRCIVSSSCEVLPWQDTFKRSLLQERSLPLHTSPFVWSGTTKSQFQEMSISSDLSESDFCIKFFSFSVASLYLGKWPDAFFLLSLEASGNKIVSIIFFSGDTFYETLFSSGCQEFTEHLLCTRLWHFHTYLT